ncbi:nuclear transport factor 2 family protein [Nocardia pseudovaccinii]|uniref:nuclear transport factor 2 family protein n=1 Tax=Nocardia pseudovaccinii TaxID=189540 RepID=UPI0014723DD1|nr:nuclear transport factor 2 family protein [Nocardia pseudovaccinii]
MTAVLAAFEAGNADAALAMMTDDATWWVAGDLPISGDHDAQGIRNMINGLSKVTVGSVKFAPVGIIAEDNRVSVEVESDADLENGKHYSNKYNLVFEFDGGRIARVREYTDTKKAHDILFG